ncbi:MAG: UDP-N-acetylglucosamine acyltransferase [Alphaproteobacteria bacterium]|nr:UDP-N-acetylglucosamine acyltransferase [Alphaproteobacteria bacterium]
MSPIERRFSRSALVMVLFLTGCTVAPPSPYNYSVPNVGLSRVKHNAELKSINVSYASQQEATGPISATDERTPELWKSALGNAVKSMAIFRNEALKRLDLSVKITRLEPSGRGFDMIANAEARYDLVDRSNGDIVYSQNIATSGKVTFGENMMVIARTIEARNIAVRNNIAIFLQSLESVDTSPTLLPTKP